MHRRVLIVEDQEINREFLRGILEDEYDVLEAKNGIEAIKVLQKESNTISAIILDLIMPKMNGYEVLFNMHQNISFAQIPVIVATGANDSENEEKALRAGAIDFVSKPYNPNILKNRLWNTINLREQAAIVNATRRDALTGLFSRSAFFERVSEMIELRKPSYYVMAAFDVDKFKIINDQYGSTMGDKALIQIAHILDNGFGPAGGITARIMGDNFAVLYPRKFMDSDEIKKIRDDLAHLDGFLAPITFAIGRYIIEDLNLEPAAMYDRAVIAKECIKGRYDEQVTIYDETMRNRILTEQEIVNDMKQALDSNQFEVWYQPQFNHLTGSLIGAEALVRWRHPIKGLISPGIFIPIFEANGFVYEVDKYVWEQACIFLKKMKDSGHEVVPISVNVSRYDIFRNELVDYIYALTKKYDISVEDLRIEITESAFSKSGEQIINVVKQFKKIGFTIEIDDFGSGYSSLNTLKDVPADVVKLDMQFLKGEGNAEKGGSILEAIVRMARWIGMSVIAEGVEKPEQADFLKSIGCNYIQGYLYSKPLPISEYEKIITDKGYAEKMTTYEVVDNYNSDTFWNPESIDSLIFNSFVGGACVFEYCNSEIETIRANDKYNKIISNIVKQSKDNMQIDWKKYMTKASIDNAVISVKEAIDTGMDVSFEMELVNFREEGESIWMRPSIRMIANTGNRYLFYCILEDLTEQRNAEIKERRTSSQMEVILKNMNAGVSASIVMKGKEPRIIFANEHFYEQRGYTKKQYQNEVKNIMDIVHSDDYKEQCQIMAQAKKDETPIKTTYRIIRRDGSIAWIRNKVSIGRLDGYDFPVQISITDDMTVEYEALAQVREKDKMLKLILQNVGSGITAVALNADKMEYLFANDSFYNLIGYTREEYNQKDMPNPFDIVKLEDRRRVQMEVNDINLMDEPKSIEYRITSKAGTTKDIRMVTVNTCNEGSDQIIQLSVFADITAEKHEEENRKELIENLPCGAGIFDITNGTIKNVYQNRNLWKKVGRTPETFEEEFKTKSIIEFVQAEDRVPLAACIQKMIINGKEQECELHFLHEDGSYVPFLTRANIVKHKSGRMSLYVVYTPITENTLTFRKMLPVALDAMMASSTDLSFIKDRTLRYVCASRAFAKSFGFDSEKEIMGKTDFELYEEKYAEKFRKEDMRIIHDGKSMIDCIEEIPSKSNISRYASTSKYLLQDDNNNVIGIYGVSRDITENKGAFERLKILTDTIPGGLATYEVTESGIRNVYLSDGVFALTGYDENDYDVHDYDPMVFIHEEDRDLVRNQINYLVETKKSIDFIYRIINKAGECRWVNLRGKVTDSTESRLTVNTVMFDITDQMTIQKKIELLEYDNRRRYEHELRLRKSLMKDSVLYYQLNLTTGVIEEFETSHKKISNMKKGVVVDQSVRDYILSKVLPEDAEKVSNTIFFAALKKAYKKGERTVSITYRRLLEDKAYYWVQTNVFLMEKPDNSEVIAFVYCKNVDEERKSKLAIETIFNEDVEAVIYVDVNKKTSTIAHMLDYFNLDNNIQDSDYNTIIERFCKDFIVEEEREQYRKFYSIPNMKKVLKKNKVVSNFYQIKTVNGVRRKLVKIYYLDHLQDIIVLSYRDITDLYIAEQKQKQELKKAVETANKASRAKSEFLSNMSHDIRTPLNAVLAFSNHELMEGADEAKLRDYLNKINTSGQYLIGIINDVLDMSRIEQNKITFNPERYSKAEFEKTIHNVIDEMSKKRNISFTMDFSKAGIHELFVDRIRFNQIFINLITNAIKFTPKGGKVEFSVEDLEVKGKNIRKKFIVRDNGIGMSKEFIPHAFDSFNQEYRKEASERNQGTGLGLSIVKELVDLMGGTIKLESTIHVGTTFTVELPLTLNLDLVKEKPKETADLNKLSGIHVLIVEDNDINAEIENALLDKYGCIIDNAENGEIACRKFKESEIGYYQLILMDIRMPVMDGLTATTKIRAMRRADAKTVPIIAMTADVFSKDEQTSFNAGMNAHLAKPIAPAMLYDICCEFL